MTKNFIGKTFGKFGSKWRDALAGILIEKNISPNILTVIGFVINIIGGVMLAVGVMTDSRINWIHVSAGFVIILANIFDMLDGTVARMSGRVTKFGAFTDSVLDRYSDMSLFGGAMIYFALRGDIPFVVVSALAFVGGIMTSYTRARAESLLPGKFDAGYMERPERIVILAATCLLSRLYMGVLFIAIFANLATFHRIWDTWKMDHNLSHPEDARKGYGSLNSSAPVRMIRNIIFWNYPRQTWQHDALGAVLFFLTLLAPLR
jgi:CDP-diacylglycerol--glycerol-3-phosphate 3-phosphatidyltransferase